jgi:hypothetical protein
MYRRTINYVCDKINCERIAAGLHFILRTYGKLPNIVLSIIGANDLCAICAHNISHLIVVDRDIVQTIPTIRLSSALWIRLLTQHDAMRVRLSHSVSADFDLADIDLLSKHGYVNHCISDRMVDDDFHAAYINSQFDHFHTGWIYSIIDLPIFDSIIAALIDRMRKMDIDDRVARYRTLMKIFRRDLPKKYISRGYMMDVLPHIYLLSAQSQSDFRMDNRTFGIKGNSCIATYDYIMGFASIKSAEYVDIVAQKLYRNILICNGHNARINNDGTNTMRHKTLMMTYIVDRIITKYPQYIHCLFQRRSTLRLGTHKYSDIFTAVQAPHNPIKLFLRHINLCPALVILIPRTQRIDKILAAHIMTRYIIKNNPAFGNVDSFVFMTCGAWPRHKADTMYRVIRNNFRLHRKYAHTVLDAQFFINPGAIKHPERRSQAIKLAAIGICADVRAINYIHAKSMFDVIAAIYDVMWHKIAMANRLILCGLLEDVVDCIIALLIDRDCDIKSICGGTKSTRPYAPHDQWSIKIS